MFNSKKVSIVLTISIILLSAILVINSQPAPKNIPQSAEGIRAKVIGKLKFEEGRGYFILAKQSKYNWESKVWLRVSENKIMVRKLQNLLDKVVTAEGELGQLPENVTAAVPPFGIYLQNFEINEFET